MSTDNFWWIQCTTLLFFSYVLSKHAHVESCHYLVFDRILPEKLEEKKTLRHSFRRLIGALFHKIFKFLNTNLT